MYSIKSNHLVMIWVAYYSSLISSHAGFASPAYSSHAIGKRDIVAQIMTDFPDSACKNIQMWGNIRSENPDDGVCLKCRVKVYGYPVEINKLAAHVVACRDNCRVISQLPEFKECILNVVKAEDENTGKEVKIWMKKPKT
ncbi:hypothetical protein LSTR_LSTR008937 [Laodelphax striatellus]|uniref:Uncharacterized protein n=1 Tax=Laodelphax striatellus TaxID=195883 RepID=A0A482WRM8_LAOST|nr:hypothetical protein LSTR_LSTR008937 [Laodelphax striatellus]